MIVLHVCLNSTWAEQKAWIAGGDSSQPHYTAERARSRRRELWMAAIKLPMYSVGIVPILVRIRVQNQSIRARCSGLVFF
jgi:hypothetical protein